MSNYHNDQPITGEEDNPDRLNRKNFAKHLADIVTLSPCDDCLTVSNAIIPLRLSLIVRE
jgi:hypothetical protein